MLPGLFLGYALYAVRIWKGDVLIADLEELETMDASEIYSKRFIAKEVILPKANGKFILPVADGRIKYKIWQYNGVNRTRANEAWTKNGVEIPWNTTAICERFKTSLPTGKLRMNEDLENVSQDQLFRLFDD